MRGMLASKAAYSRPTTTKTVGIHVTEACLTAWLAPSLATLVGMNTSYTGAFPSRAICSDANNCQT